LPGIPALLDLGFENDPEFSTGKIAPSKKVIIRIIYANLSPTLTLLTCALAHRNISENPLISHSLMLIHLTEDQRNFGGRNGAEQKKAG
jgi:hypothetical protein